MSFGLSNIIIGTGNGVNIRDSLLNINNVGTTSGVNSGSFTRSNGSTGEILTIPHNLNNRPTNITFDFMKQYQNQYTPSTIGFGVWTSNNNNNSLSLNNGLNINISNTYSINYENQVGIVTANNSNIYINWTQIYSDNTVYMSCIWNAVV